MTGFKLPYDFCNTHLGYLCNLLYNKNILNLHENRSISFFMPIKCLIQIRPTTKGLPKLMVIYDNTLIIQMVHKCNRRNAHLFTNLKAFAGGAQVLVGQIHTKVLENQDLRVKKNKNNDRVSSKSKKCYIC